MNKIIWWNLNINILLNVFNKSENKISSQRIKHQSKGLIAMSDIDEHI